MEMRVLLLFCSHQNAKHRGRICGRRVLLQARLFRCIGFGMRCVHILRGHLRQPLHCRAKRVEIKAADSADLPKSGRNVTRFRVSHFRFTNRRDFPYEKCNVSFL
jgi:hypothetical protein